MKSCRIESAALQQVESHDASARLKKANARLDECQQKFTRYALARLQRRKAAKEKGEVTCVKA